MPDLKANYDRVLLAALGLVAAVVAFLLVGGAMQLKDQANLPPQTAKQEPFVAERSVELLKEDLAAMAESKPWSTSEASPFVSRVYLLKDGRLVDILESGNELFPGIANAWILEHNLDYLDPALPEQDPDSDGFTNFEEFTAKTNPRDASSKPALWTKLRLIATRIEKLRFHFRSLPRGSADIVAINTINPSDPTQLTGATQFYPRSSEMVDTPEGRRSVDPKTLLLAERSPDGRQVFQPTPYRFERVEMTKRFNKAINAEQQIPIAILLNTGDGQTVRLELDEIKDSPYPLATFQDSRSNAAPQELNIGGVIDLGEGVRYKLVDVSEENATIEDLGTGERHVIPKVSAPPAVQPPSEDAPIQ